MGFVWVHFIVSLCLAASSQNSDNVIVVKKLRTVEQITAEYCRIKTATYLDDQCGRPSDVLAMDVVYLPLSMAAKIADHVRSAYDKKYYFNLSLKDFFHGHLLARGPRVVYTSPADYFSDVQLILYHSQEYLSTWEEIEGYDPFVPHEQQRSFVGWFGENQEVIPAIDLLDRSLYPKPYTMSTLRGYRGSGTVYMKDLNASVKQSLHNYDGTRIDFYMQGSDDMQKKCEIFQQIYLLEESGGRFVSPDGKRYDITLHCRYLRDTPSAI